MRLTTYLYALPHLDDSQAREPHPVLDVAHRLDGQPDHSGDDAVKGRGGSVQEPRRRPDPVGDLVRVRDRVRVGVRGRVRVRPSQ